MKRPNKIESKLIVLSFLFCCMVSINNISYGELSEDEVLAIKETLHNYEIAMMSVDSAAVLECISTNSPMNGKYGITKTLYEETASDLEKLGKKNSSITCKIRILDISEDGSSANVKSKYTLIINKRRELDDMPLTWHLIKDDDEWKIMGYTAVSLDLQEDREIVLLQVRRSLEQALADKNIESFANTIWLIEKGIPRDARAAATMDSLDKLGYGEFKSYFGLQEATKKVVVKLTIDSDQFATLIIHIQNTDDNPTEAANFVHKSIRISNDRIDILAETTNETE